jgi:hypothetical protein
MSLNKVERERYKHSHFTSRLQDSTVQNMNGNAMRCDVEEAKLVG